MIGHLRVAKAGSTSKAQVLVLPVSEKGLERNAYFRSLGKVEQKKILDRAKHFEFTGKSGETLNIEDIADYSLAIVFGLGKEGSVTPVSFREALADVIRTVRGCKFSSVTLVLESAKDVKEFGKQIGLAVHLANYSFLEYKSEKEQGKAVFVKDLSVETPPSQEKELLEGFGLADAMAKGVYLARDLVNRPASHLGPDDMVAAAKEIEKKSKGRIKVTVLEEAECRRLGMGAYLGVAQGSEKKPKFIILETVAKSPKQTVCFIGKSIMFDSGGLSLKPSSAMEDMKIDMAGAAAVLGVFTNISSEAEFLSKLSSKVKVYGIIPACENMPSGKALRPGDVVRALNGKTIEVLNTDAEGRLALADALSYAEKYLKPDYIIDLATLTGACMVALGNDLAGLFANDKDFKKTFSEIAKSQGDALWPLPLYKPYAKGMKSPIADLKNITGKGYGGAITAALFLREFVDKTKWIHLDIAGPAHRSEGPRGTLPQGGTGWGVMSLTEYLVRLIKN